MLYQKTDPMLVRLPADVRANLYPRRAAKDLSFDPATIPRYSFDRYLLLHSFPQDHHLSPEGNMYGSLVLFSLWNRQQDQTLQVSSH